jgi:hypothetical protein
LERLVATLACSGAVFGCAATAAALPTAAQIVARYDRALGGEAALRHHTSSTMRGTTLGTIRGGGVVRLPFVFYARAPYYRFNKFSWPAGRGDVLNGFDGRLAWRMDQRTGPQILTGNARLSDKRDADFYYPLDELTWFKSMIPVGIVRYEGYRCYHLHGINKWGISNDHFYDVETGLLVGYEFPAQLAGETHLVHEIFSDYRRVDGVLFPMKQTLKVKSKVGNDWTVRQTQLYTTVTFNDVDPAVFVPPQAVRDLATKATTTARPS